MEKLTLKKTLRHIITFTILLPIICIWLPVVRAVEVENDISLFAMSMEDLEEEPTDSLEDTPAEEDLEDAPIEDPEEMVDEPEIEVDDNIVTEDEAEIVDISENENLVEIRLRQLQDQTEFLSGELIQFHIGASLDGIFPAGTIFEVAIPRRHINDNATFQVSPISGQTPPIMTRTGTAQDGYFIIRYNLNVPGGLEFDAPIQMVANNGNTPNGFEIPIKARLTNNDNDLLTEETDLTFTINTVEPILSKRVMVAASAFSGYSWSPIGANNISVGRAGLESLDNPGHLSTDLRELTIVNFSYFINSPGILGNRYFEQITFHDTIPVEALFIQELNPDWTFDETTRTATFERNFNTMINSSGIGSSGSLDTSPAPASASFNPMFATQLMDNLRAPVLRLYFPGVAIGQIMTNNARITMRGSGTDCNINPLDCFELEDYLNFDLDVNSRNFNGAISKSPLENPDVNATNNVAITSERLLGENTRSPDPDDTRNYTINLFHRASFVDFTNPSPVHLPHLPLGNVTISDHSLDPSLYFRGITIPARGANIFTNNSTGKLPGFLEPRTPGTINIGVILSDGSTVMIAEDIEIITQQHFDFSDFGFNPHDIDEFFVETTENSYFLPPLSSPAPVTDASNIRFQVIVHTGARDPSERIIPEDETGRALDNHIAASLKTLNHETIERNYTARLAYRLVEPAVGLQHAPTMRRIPPATTLPSLNTGFNNAQTGIYRVGERRHFRLDVNVLNILGVATIDTDKIFVLLPAGLEFIPGSIEFHSNTAGGGTSTAMTAAQLNDEVEVTLDFEGTGQTGLLFHLRPFTRGT